MLKKLLAALMFPAIFFGGSESKAGEVIAEIGSQRIVIPTVPEFVDVGREPSLTRLAVSLIEPNAKLISGFFRKDAQDRYIILKTPKALETATLSVADFKGMKDSMKRSTANMSRVGDLATSQAVKQRQEVNAASHHDFKDMKFGEPAILEVERDDEYGFGYTAITKIKGNIDGKSVAWNSLMCANVLRVKGKLIFVQVFANHNSQADIDWLRGTCRTFVSSLISAN
jgi:hypothetical protein